MSKNDNEIRKLEEKIAQEKVYIKVAEREGMPKMKKYYKESIAKLKSVIETLKEAS